MGEVALLIRQLKAGDGQESKLELLLRDYAQSLHLIRKQLHEWIDIHITPFPEMLRLQALTSQILRLDALIRMVESGIASLFSTGWIISSLELQLLSELSCEPLELDKYDE